MSKHKHNKSNHTSINYTSVKKQMPTAPLNLEALVYDGVNVYVKSTDNYIYKVKNVADYNIREYKNLTWPTLYERVSNEVEECILSIMNEE